MKAPLVSGWSNQDDAQVAFLKLGRRRRRRSAETTDVSTFVEDNRVRAHATL